MSGMRGAVCLDKRRTLPSDVPFGKKEDGWSRLVLSNARAYLEQKEEAQTPESNGRRACVTASGISLASVVRLDNRDELRLALGWDLGAESLPDEEYVVGAYLRWGADAATRLLGDFALALWDERNQCLTLMRDQLGVVPLYHFVSRGVLYFSTNIKDLLGLVESPAVCEEQVFDFLTVDFENTRNTFYEGIRRVAPGSIVVVDDAVRESRYYRMRLPEVPRGGTNEELADEFLATLSRAVGDRLRSIHNPTLFLSGGLDSSFLYGLMAREIGSAQIDTCSATFPKYPAIDETAYISQVIQGSQGRAQFVPVDEELPFSSTPHDILVQGQPFYSPNNYVDRALLDHAKSSGARLVIDGLDGDTTVGHGWEVLTDLFLQGRWRRLAGMARSLSAFTDRSAWFFLHRHVLAPLFGATLVLHGVSELPGRTFLAHEFAQRMEFHDRMQLRIEGRARLQFASFREKHLAKLSSGLLPLSFEIAQTQATTRGIVRRHPYFDLRLVEFCLSLSSEQRLDRGVDRMVQRRAAGGLVPEDIRRRLTKSIWEKNFRDRTEQEERTVVAGIIDHYGEAIRPYISIDNLKDSVNKALSGKASNVEFSQIWMAHSLGAWLTRLTTD